MGCNVVQYLAVCVAVCCSLLQSVAASAVCGRTHTCEDMTHSLFLQLQGGEDA